MKNFINCFIATCFCLTAYCGEVLKEMWSIKVDDVTGDSQNYPGSMYVFTGYDGSVALEFPMWQSTQIAKGLIVWISSAGEVLSTINTSETFSFPDNPWTIEILGCSNQMLTFLGGRDILPSPLNKASDVRVVQYIRTNQGLVAKRSEAIGSTVIRSVWGADTFNKNVIVTLKSSSGFGGPYSIVCYQLVNQHNSLGGNSESGFLSQYISFKNQPFDQYAVVGGSAEFKVDVVSSIPVTYQWQKNNKDLQGYVLSGLTINKTSNLDSGVYTLIVKSVFGSVTSAPSNLEIVSLPIIKFPTNRVSGEFGKVTTLAPTVISQGPTFYRWFKDNVILSGETQSSIKIPTDSASAEYVVECQNVAGNVKSETIIFNAFVLTNGFKKWEFSEQNSDNSRYSPPAIGNDGTVYFVERFSQGNGGYLYAVDGASGLKKWRFYTGHGNDWRENNENSLRDANDLAPVVGPGNIVYVCSSKRGENLVFAIDGATGKKRWQALVQSDRNPDRGSKIKSPAIGTDGTVYAFRSDGRYLFAFNGNTGLKKWESLETDLLIDYHLGHYPAVRSDGTVWVGFQGLDGATGKSSRGYKDGFIFRGSSIGFGNLVYVYKNPWESGVNHAITFAIDSDSLKERWSFHFPPETIPSNPVTGSNGLIYIGAGGKYGAGGEFYALDGLAGNVKWKIKANGYEPYGATVGSDGTVYVSIDGGLSALNGLTGEIDWEFDKGGGYISPPAINSDGTLYAVQGSRLIALASKSKGLHNSPWPKSRSDNQNSSRVSSGFGPLAISDSPQSGLNLDIPVSPDFDTILEYSTNLNQWSEQQRFGRQTNVPSIVVPLKMDQTKSMEYWRTRSQ